MKSRLRLLPQSEDVWEDDFLPEADHWMEFVAEQEPGAGRGEMAMNRVTITPAIHGKLTYNGKVSEPDVMWIVEKWLERHPELKERRHDIRAVHGQWTTEEGLRTEVVTVSVVAGDDIAGYDPDQDADLYQYWMAEPRYWEAG